MPTITREQLETYAPTQTYTTPFIICPAQEDIDVDDLTQFSVGGQDNCDYSSALISLNQYLKCTDGKLVELYYKNHQCFDNSTRNLLSRVIINKEYETKYYPEKFKISAERFQLLVSEIILRFPTEKKVKDIYYVPHNPVSKVHATGKLFDAYNHLKAKFSKFQKINKAVAVNELQEETDDNIIIGKIAFLKNNLSPWEKVHQLWNETKTHRTLLLNKSNSVHEYFETFPILATTNGSILLVQDFDKLYPESADKFFITWPKIEKQILIHAQNKRNKDIQDVLKGKCEFKGLLILAHVLGQSVYVKNIQTPTNSTESCSVQKKAIKRRKLTTIEVLNSFLHLQEVILTLL